MYLLVASSPDGGVQLQRLGSQGNPSASPDSVAPDQFAEAAGRIEATERPRWVWLKTTHWYPQLLAESVPLERCHDLALCAAILTHSAYIEGYVGDPSVVGAGQPLPPQTLAAAPPSPHQGSLFDHAAPSGPPLDALMREFAEQLAAVARSPQRQRLALLLAAESAGALAAVEMQYAGMPWDADVHDAVLAERLGPRPPSGSRPELLEAKAAELRTLLDAPAMNPDSPQELMRALHRAGIEARTTRAWELREFSHPAIPPLLEYKKMARLLTANGWAWLDEWVTEGRFRPEYVVGGVVTGRWSSRGGGALQIPAQIRSAARALPGHRLVVADASAGPGSTCRR